MKSQLRCCYTASTARLCQLSQAVLLFVCLLACMFISKMLLYFGDVIWFVLAFNVLSRQAEWKFQLEVFICSPCRLREQSSGPVGLHVINLLGTMKTEHLNVSCVFRQALSEGLFICVVRRMRNPWEESICVHGCPSASLDEGRIQIAGMKARWGIGLPFGGSEPKILSRYSFWQRAVVVDNCASPLKVSWRQSRWLVAANK